MKIAFRFDRLANYSHLLIYFVLLGLILTALTGCSPDRSGAGDAGGAGRIVGG